VPKVDILKGAVTDADLPQFFTEPADYSGSGLESEAPASASLTEAIPRARETAVEPPQTNVNPLQEQLLMDIRNHPKVLQSPTR
jgi:hypothetical protein